MDPVVIFCCVLVGVVPAGLALISWWSARGLANWRREDDAILARRKLLRGKLPHSKCSCDLCVEWRRTYLKQKALDE